MYHGILARGNSTLLLLDKLVKIQKRAIRIVNKTGFYAHTTELFYSNRVLKLTDLYLYNIGIFMYKLSNNELPESFMIIFKKNNYFHTYPTRQSGSFHLPRTRTLFAQKTILFSGPKFWNDLPNEITTSPSLRVFKRKLKLLLLLKYSK